MRRAVKSLATLVTALLLVFAAACIPAPAAITPAPAPAPEPTPTSIPTPEDNFRLLISDDVNAIGEFVSVNITISSVGVQKGGESGKWFEFPPATEELDLVPLQGENAQEIWSGNLTDGRYTKVFIYVSDINAVLKTGETVDDVKLPSEKLHINTHFNIPEDTPVSFVFDLTMVAAGNQQSGIKYILKPVVSESGPKQKFTEVTPPVIGEEEGVEEELEFEGTIEAIAGDNWTMTIDDEEWTVDVSGAEIEGEPAVGLEAEIEGTVVDDTLIASEVEIKEAEEEEGEEEGEEIETEAPEALEITTTSLPDGQVGENYTATLEAIGGTEPYIWDVSAGDLPDGLTLDSATGVISGTPTTEGDYSFTVQVEDSSDPTLSTTQELSIEIEISP